MPGVLKWSNVLPEIHELSSRRQTELLGYVRMNVYINEWCEDWENLELYHMLDYDVKIFVFVETSSLFLN